MNPFLKFLKDVFISKFWIKAICLILAVFMVFLLNM